MEKENCFYLGKVTKVVGFKGEVAVYIDSDEPEKYASLQTVFLDVYGNFVPYFVEKLSMRNKSNQYTIKFQDVDSLEEAARLVDSEMYLPLELLPPLEGDAFYFHEIKGFKIFDEEKGFIGHVLQVIDYPGNPLFEIQFEDKTLLVPLRDQFLNKLDRAGQSIHICAPEGLIDLYLNG